MQPTIKDVARKCGVAHTTASDILNRNKADIYADKTVAKVRRTAEKMGYKANYFAASLKSGRTNFIGIRGAADSMWGLFHPYLSNVYAGFTRYFRDNAPAYRFILQQFQDPQHETADLDLVQEKLVDGLLYIILSRSIPGFIRNQLPALKKSGSAFVALHSTSEKLACPNVTMDSRAAGYLGTKHLLEHGYQSIGFAYSSRGEHPHEHEMFLGHEQACNEAGIRHGDRYNFYNAGYTTENGEALAERIIREKQKLPRALFVCSDSSAYGMQHVFRQHDIRTPEDLAMVGFGDDIHPSFIKTYLTSVRQPAFKKGQAAAEMLYSQIKGGKPGKTRSVVLQPDLKIRTSCGCK